MSTVCPGGVRTVTEILTDEFKKKGHNVIWLLQRHYFNNQSDYPPKYKVEYLPYKEITDSRNIKFYNNLVRNNQINIVINQTALFESIKLTDSLIYPDVKRISVLHSSPLLNYKYLFKDITRLRNNSVIEKFKLLARIVLYPKIKKKLLQSRVSHLKELEKGQSYIVTLSPYYTDLIKKFIPNYKNIINIYNPLKYNNDSIKSHKKENIVLFVGRLDNKIKQINVLLRIWEIVSKSVNNWKLLIIGDGPDLNYLIKISLKLKNVEFKGQTDPLKYYEKAAIICLTSLYEGFPMILLEGMQNGCVPITFDSFPAVHDIIINGYNGEIVKNRDLKDYKNKLINLMTNKKYLNYLSKNAIESLNKFDREIIMSQWETLINKNITK